MDGAWNGIELLQLSSAHLKLGLSRNLCLLQQLDKTQVTQTKNLKTSAIVLHESVVHLVRS